MRRYSSVREKLLDPRYEGFFLKYNPGGSSDFNNGTWHAPKCTESKVALHLATQLRHLAMKKRDSYAVVGVV
eukprot:COSAG03_NODE_1407_length_4140_cov_3.756001_6_plen_72_part_00